MANKTIGIFSGTYAGTSGAKMLLKSPVTGAVMNTSGGDELTEVSAGFFTCTVSQAISGWFAVVVIDSANGLLIEGGWVSIPSDAAGLYVVDDPTAQTGVGYGPRTVLITVTDGTDGLPGSVVTLSRGGLSRTVVAGTGGVARFNVTDGDWDVAIESAGYDFSGAVLTVAGNTTQTYPLDPITISPSSPGFVTGYWVVRSVNGTPYAGVAVLVRAVRPVAGSTGTIHAGENRTATSDANGIASFTNLIPGWLYRVTIDGVVSAEVAIAPNATGTVSLGSAVLPTV